LYTSCVLGLCPSALFNEFLLIKKKNIEPSNYKQPVTHKYNKLSQVYYYPLALIVYVGVSSV
jgi:hypothetical protein